MIAQAPRLPAPALPTVRWSGAALRLAGLAGGLLLVCGVALLSLRLGSITMTTRDAWDAVFNYSPTDYDQVVVRMTRLPRTIIALALGAALAVAGATSQAVTRNPLADPAILGISGGSTLGIVIAVFYLDLARTGEFVWFAFAGAVLASALVFGVASAGRGGASPVKLALSGVVIAWLLAAWTNTLLLLDRETMDVVRFWLAGSVAGRKLDTLWTVGPFLLVGTVACTLMAHQLNVMSMGEEAARALGLNTTRVRAVAFGLVVLLTGAAVSVAGPIAFVGLATPHIARALVGPDYRWVMPYSILIGAGLLTAADTLGRLVVRPAELQVGIMTALAGAPFLILLARRRSVAG